MCGICGFSGKTDDRMLEDMGSELIHRGPDDKGSFSDGMMNLYARRLSILDVEKGKQPVHNEDGSIQCVFNGEIYNYVELFEELKKKGYRFHSDHSDTELIVYLYEVFGEQFVHRLNGMFAIALWDGRRKRLLLVRDRLGVKPLFYMTANQEIIFGSEIKALQKHSLFDKNIDLYALYQFFSFQSICAPRTAFEKVRALEAGTMLIWEEGNLQIKKYWEPNFCQNAEPDFRRAAEQLKELLYDAVRLRLRADVPVGVFLSGGLDSSVIAAMAAQEKNKIQSFCLDMSTAEKGRIEGGRTEGSRIEGSRLEDATMAKLLAEKKGFEHSVFSVSPREVPEAVDEIIRAFDQPYAGTVSTFFLAKAMKGQRKTVLTGDGADELFGSYRHHMMAAPFAYYSRSRKQGILADEMAVSQLKPMENDIPFLEALYEYAGSDETMAAYRLLRMTDEDKEIFLNEDLFGNMCYEKQTLKEMRDADARLRGTDPLNRSLERDIRVLLPNQILTYTDALSMSQSLEIRCPFMDYRVVEYVCSLSGQLKMKDGEIKALLKEAAKQILPSEIIKRKKLPFSLPIVEWMQSDLKEYVTDVLQYSSVKRHGILNAECVQYALKQFYDNPTEKDYYAQMLWNFVMFERWFELYN